MWGTIPLVHVLWSSTGIAAFEDHFQHGCGVGSEVICSCVLQVHTPQDDMGLCGTSSPQRPGKCHQEFDSKSFVPDPNVISLEVQPERKFHLSRLVLLFQLSGLGLPLQMASLRNNPGPLRCIGFL